MDFKSFIMKKLLFVSFLFIYLSSFSQGNLQFNKVINLNYTGAGVNVNKKLITTVNIPDGKVWKITYVYAQAADSSRGYIPYKLSGTDFHLEIGGIFIPGGTGGNGLPTESGALNGSVPWLDSGNTEIYIVTYENNSSYNVSITAIEFNIIQ